MAYTEEDLESILDDFAKTATRYGLTISIKKTEVMFQPKPGHPPLDPVIKIGDDEQLNVVQKFCYLATTYSHKMPAYGSRIGKASAAILEDFIIDFGLIMESA